MNPSFDGKSCHWQTESHHDALQLSLTVFYESQKEREREEAIKEAVTSSARARAKVRIATTTSCLKAESLTAGWFASF